MRFKPQCKRSLRRLCVFFVDNFSCVFLRLEYDEWYQLESSLASMIKNDFFFFLIGNSLQLCQIFTSKAAAYLGKMLYEFS
jgi:hypothetical protein